jgi:plastocyanin
MRIHTPMAAFAALSMVVFASLGAAVASAAPGDAQVTIKNFDFHPMAVSVPVGGSVTWTNLDGEPHTITSADGSFRSGALDEDDTYSFKFSKPGVYQYLCTIHPKMRAMVTVK